MGWSNPNIRDLVIRTLIGEGASGDADSWASVANVLKNRAITGKYGEPSVNGLTNTIRAPKQFSMWNEGMNSSGKTISPSDPNYIRAGQVADAVFNGNAPDNTGGADHYYAPGGMAGGPHAPSWAIGQTPTATIGGQHFFKLGLSGSDAINQGHTSAGPIGAPAAPASASPLVGSSPASATAAVGAVGRALADAHALLGKNEVPDHAALMDYLKTGGQNLDPHQSAWCAAFVSASLAREGLPVPNKVVADSQFAGGANARDYLNYGAGVTDPNAIQAGDILVAKDGTHVGFAEGPVRQGANGPEVQILAGNEKDTSGQYTPGSWTNPQTGQVANRAQVGMVAERWAPVSDFVVRRAPAADGGAAAPAVAAAPATPAANAPAAAAQPVSATAPGSSGGNFAAPPGGASQGPGSGVVLQGMMSGGGKTPITAADWSGLFGGKAAPVATPPAAPAASPAATPPASAPPVTVAQGAPVNQPPGSPSASLVRNFGSDLFNDPSPVNPAPSTDPPPDARIPKSTPGTPSMGFPAMTNPFGQFGGAPAPSPACRIKPQCCCRARCYRRRRACSKCSFHQTT